MEHTRITFTPIDLKRVTAECRLDMSSAHGFLHWTRVLQNAMAIAEAEELDGERVKALYFSALYHDSQRVSENNDHGHGGRGAALMHRQFVLTSGMTWFTRILATEMCTLHTELMPWNISELCRHLSEDDFHAVSIFCDADRLDLTRFGWIPDEARLFNDVSIQAVRTFVETSEPVMDVRLIDYL